MTAEELKKAVAEITTEQACSMQLYLILKSDNEFCLRLADVEDAVAMPGLKSLFISELDATITKNAELVVKSLAKDDEQNNALYLYDYESYPEELKLIHDFTISEAVKAEKFKFSEDDLSSLFGYIVYIGTMENGVALLKKHYPISLIKRDSFLLGAKKSNKRFEKIEGQDILRINGSWQLINVSGQLYVWDLKVLERNLGFTQLVEKSARDAIDSIGTLGIVENIDALSDELDNLTFARKLARIQESSAVFSKKIPTDRILEFSKTTPALSGQFQYSEAGTTIILSTKKQKDAFLRLLNDDFLHSELTTEYYAANSKDALKS